MVKHWSPSALSGVVDSLFAGDHRRKGEQAEDPQKGHVWKSGAYPLKATIVTRWVIGQGGESGKNMGFSRFHQKVG
jgi:hypothetical protein